MSSGVGPAIIGNTHQYNALKEEEVKQKMLIDEKAKRAAELQARIQAKMAGKVINLPLFILCSERVKFFNFTYNMLSVRSAGWLWLQFMRC